MANVTDEQCKARTGSIKRWLAVLVIILTAAATGVWVYVAGAAELRARVDANTQSIRELRTETRGDLNAIRATTTATRETVAEIKGLLKKRNGN